MNSRRSHVKEEKCLKPHWRFSGLSESLTDFGWLSNWGWECNSGLFALSSIFACLKIDLCFSLETWPYAYQVMQVQEEGGKALDVWLECKGVSISVSCDLVRLLLHFQLRPILTALIRYLRSADPTNVQPTSFCFIIFVSVITHSAI